MTAPILEELNGNALLSKLREHDRKRLLPHLMTFNLKSNDILQEAGRDVVHTWFPCDSAQAAFTIWVDENNPALEVAQVGREGAVGGIVSNGSAPAYATSQVSCRGKFLRIKTSALEEAKLDSIALRHWFSRYSDCLIAQIFQTAACNATHTIVQRTAKWLLAAVARTNGDEVEMTHDRLAEMLGVGRTFVTRIVSQLRHEGVIATRRGVFVVKDGAALRERSCGCTTAIEMHFDTVLHEIYPR